MSNIVGIDVGIGTIKVVSVSKNDKGVVLDAIGETKNPKIDWLKDGKGIDQVAAAIKILLSDLKIRPKQVVACLPEDEVISRLVHLPPLKESEIRDALRFEAETFIPYPLDEVSIDYEVIEEEEGGRLTVFVIAARNVVIQSYIKLFKTLGLELLALESPAVAMKRIVRLLMPKVEGIVVVDLGEKFSDIINMNKNNIYLTRSMAVGGESITRAISINLGLDMASAEEYKKAYGLKEMELEGKIKNAIAPVFASMADEIRKTIALFTETLGKSPDLLVLSGGGANMPGLAEEFTKILGIEVQVIQPFLAMDTTRIVVPLDLDVQGCRFSIAVGLALRGVA